MLFRSEFFYSFGLNWKFPSNGINIYKINIIQHPAGFEPATRKNSRRALSHQAARTQVVNNMRDFFYTSMDMLGRLLGLSRLRAVNYSFLFFKNINTFFSDYILLLLSVLFFRRFICTGQFYVSSLGPEP